MSKFAPIAILSFCGIAFALGLFSQETTDYEKYYAPLKVPRKFFNGIHVAKNNAKDQMEAQHYCSPLKNGMIQCILFDATGTEAKLMGIEYIVSDDVYKTLPAREKKYWHPHPFEILGGGLIAPGMDPAEEKKFMGVIMNTWGKTFHTWPNSMSELPLGDPVLMWSLGGPGQVDPGVLRQRDQTFHVNSAQIAERRKKEFGYQEPNVTPPNSLDAAGRRWTNDGPDVPTPLKP